MFIFPIFRPRPIRISLSQRCVHQLPTPSLCSKAHESDLFCADFPSPTTCLVRRSAFPTSHIAVETYFRLLGWYQIAPPSCNWKCQPPVPWSSPLFKRVRLVSISIATVQAPISQSDPCLRFGATPLVPCPFPIQPNPAPFVE